jgi:hypothetical protein
VRNVDPTLLPRPLSAHRQHPSVGELPNNFLESIHLLAAGDELVHGCLATGVLGALSGLGETQEDPLGDRLALSVEAAVDGFRTGGESAADSAALAVALEG